MTKGTIFPLDQHNAYNDTTLVDLVTSYDNVVAWFNGHNHAGNYGFAGGTHFITFKGMLDTAMNSYATFQAYDDRLVVEGFRTRAQSDRPNRRPRIRSLILVWVIRGGEAAADEARRRRA